MKYRIPRKLKKENQHACETLRRLFRRGGYLVEVKMAGFTPKENKE